MRDFWEFPGGKVEPGESPHAALCRELAEELGIDELEVEHLRQIEHDYPDLHVCIDFFIVSAWHGTPTGKEGAATCAGLTVAETAMRSSLLRPADARDCCSVLREDAEPVAEGFNKY